MSKEMVGALDATAEHEKQLGVALAGLSAQFESQLNPAIDASVQFLTRIVSEFTRASAAANEYSEATIHAALAQGRLSFSPVANVPVIDPTGDILRQALAGGGGRSVTVNAKPQVPDFTTGRSKGAGKGKADHSEEQGAEDQWHTALDAAREYDQQTQTILDNELKRHQITEDEWLKQTTAALEGEKAAIQSAAQAALSSAALSSGQKLEIARQELRALAAIAEDELKSQEKAADDAAKAWQNFFKPLNSAVESQIGALISSHETVAAALKKTLDSMAADVIKFFVQWGLKAAENVVAQTAGNNLILASQQATSLGGVAAMLGNAARAIAVDAGQTAAGVTAFMAPFTGPAAVGIGQAAGASVLGMAAFDVGAWDLPGDMPAMVHKNELIMPAAEAGAFRNMLSTAASQGKDSGGGVAIQPTTHFHVNTIDSADTASFLRRNGSDIAKSLDQAVRHGAALGLKRLNGR